MSETELSRELLSDRVYGLIRASILAGDRVPGSRIVESEIARRLKVSQAPVREAVKRLVHDGLVTSEAYRGSYVTEVSEDEFVVAREVRASIEGIAAEAASGKVTEEQVEQLRAIVASMSEAIATDDWAAFRTLDLRFHGLVVGISGHAVLSRMWGALEPFMVSQRAIGDPAYSGSRASLAGWHADLVDVLESGDTEKAGALFREHAAGKILPSSDS